MDVLLIGRRLRWHRHRAGLTLEGLSTRSRIAPTQLSQFENGRREPRLSQLNALASALQIGPDELLHPEAPDERTALEVRLLKAQNQVSFRAAGLPAVGNVRRLSDEVLQERSSTAAATAEQVREAHRALQQRMRTCDNYLPDIEQLATDLLRTIDHQSGALTHHNVARLAAAAGLALVHVDDLPSGARAVLDLRQQRVYLPPASEPGGHGLRSLALQAIGHRVLVHPEPKDYPTLLEQRLEVAYFAAACLASEPQAVRFLLDAKSDRQLAVEDFRDAFGVTHEVAARRMTNLGTKHLGLRTHFLRVSSQGVVQKAYENDGLPLPRDIDGCVEGQVVHWGWAARRAFDRPSRTPEYYQYTDTDVGTFWCSSQVQASPREPFSVGLGVRFEDSRWFRGRDTTDRIDTMHAQQPGLEEEQQLAARWQHDAWPFWHLPDHLLRPMPLGRFPGVDDTELYRFLARHEADA